MRNSGPHVEFVAVDSQERRAELAVAVFQSNDLRVVQTRIADVADPSPSATP